jgi:hypothetical protein
MGCLQLYVTEQAEQVKYCLFCVGITAVVASRSTRCVIRCDIRYATRSSYSDNLLGRLTRGAYSARLLGNEALGRLVVGIQIYTQDYSLFKLELSWNRSSNSFNSTLRI